MKRVAFTGPPHAGKTTLIKELQTYFPEAHVTPEPATQVIGQYGAATWTSVTTSPCAFSQLCIEEAVKTEQAIPEGTDIVFMDRSIVDAIGYMSRDSCAVPERALEVARSALFHAVLFCESVGTLKDRPESPDEAFEAGRRVRFAYAELGATVIDVPAMPVSQRVAFVAQVLDDMQP